MAYSKSTIKDQISHQWDDLDEQVKSLDEKITEVRSFLQARSVVKQLNDDILKLPLHSTPKPLGATGLQSDIKPASSADGPKIPEFKPHLSSTKTPDIKPHPTGDKPQSRAPDRTSIIYDPSSLRPRFPIFSGEPKSETSFDVWKFEVQCAMREGTCSEALILQSIRSSLKGKARSLLLTLPPKAGPSRIIDKLEGVYGNIYPSEQLIQQFYAATQEANESVADYGMRLEGLLQTCIDRGDISPISRNEMLRTKLWSGLSNEGLRNASRYKYDTIVDFDKLRIELRTIELDMHPSATSATASSVPTPGKSDKKPQVSKVSEQPPKDKTLDTILKKLDSLGRRMDDLEKGVTGQNAPLYNKDNPDYRGRGSNRGGSRRGDFRGGYRGAYSRSSHDDYSSGYRDGYSGESHSGSYDNEFGGGYRGSDGGRYRGRYRGGSRGGPRGTNRGFRGYGNQDHDSLNW